MNEDDMNQPNTEQALKSLQDVFGFPEWLKGQEAVVTRLLAGRSVLAVFPTGAGKSLCFQLPSQMLDGLTLVISPLIALMKDQLDFLVSKNVSAARLDSSLDREATLAVYDELNQGRLKLLYISPERLNNERFLHSLARRKISLLAIDEAHCISEWGHNFRPDYLKIARLAKQLRVERVLTLTATATPKVADDICRQFEIAAEDVVHTGFYRPNLRLAVTPCSAAARGDLLLSRLAKRAPGSAVVYVTLQRTAEEVAARLAQRGYPARAYHAGMETEERTAVQDEFMTSDRLIVVATIAFGMGVDKSNIRYVYHYNLPKSLESYSQEIGRAGRDGNESICELFACPDDVVVLENFSYGDTPTLESVRGLLDDLFQRGAALDVSVHESSRLYDMRPLVVKTLLTYLELDGVIQSTGPFYSGLKFQPQKNSREILARFDARRAEFLGQVFRQAKKGVTWFSLDVDAAAAAIGAPREKIVAAIGYLEEHGDLIVEASGLREGYRVLAPPGNRAELAADLMARFVLREEHDIQRIRRVLQFAETPDCLTRHLLDYFGESRPDCGHCSRCAKVAAQPLPPPSYTPPAESSRPDIDRLRAEGNRALQTPRQLTRFLCGIASPATSRDKLRQHPLFGLFESVPFQEVLDFVNR
jgi:ATP-dependent DNA helicase RecQ